MSLDNDVISQELGILITKSVVSQIPIVGKVLSEFVDFENKVKQARFNQFVEEFKKGMEIVNETEIDYQYIRSEDFFDFFSSVIRRVTRTRSEEKIKRFKDILINQIKSEYKSDFIETFLDIATSLNEKQITILEEYRKLHLNEITFQTENHEYGSIKIGDGDKSYLNYKYFGLEKDLYLFYVQDLISKSLLYDDSQGRFRQNQPFLMLKITPLGQEFLKFLKR